jgi:hypothetical protein
VLDERIVKRARAYVPSYRLVSESEEGGRYLVRLQAELALPQIRQELRQIPGLAGAVESRPLAGVAGTVVGTGARPATEIAALQLLPVDPGPAGAALGRWTRASDRALRSSLAAAGVRVEPGAPATLRLRGEAISDAPYREGTVARLVLGQVRLRAWVDRGQGQAAVEREVVGYGLGVDAAAARKLALRDAGRAAGEIAAGVLRPGGEVAPGGSAVAGEPAGPPAGATAAAGLVLQIEGLRAARLGQVVAAVQAELPGELAQLRLGAHLELELLPTSSPPADRSARVIVERAARVQAALSRLAGVPVEARPAGAQRVVLRWPEGTP